MTMTETKIETIQRITYEDKNADNESVADTDNRNVSNDYKHLPLKMIRESIDEKRLPLVNVFFNLTSDFNKATAIRNSNAFLADSVYLIGKRRFDKRGTVGTHHYENIWHSSHWEDVFTHLKAQGYMLYAVDNTPDFHPLSIYDISFPLKTALVFGEENLGLSDEVVRACDHAVAIPQAGSVRSLNVGVASGVLMSEYMRSHRYHVTT